MQIRLQNAVFVAESQFAEKDAVKSAGFWWHGQPCRPNCHACAAAVPYKVWWTPKKEVASRLVEHGDDAVKAACAEVVEAVQASQATEADIEIPVPAGLSYMPFQRAGIAYSLRRFKALAEAGQTGGVLIADEMGLGKTVQTLGIINADRTIKSVLLLCPASLRLNWLREAKKWLVREFKFHVVESAEAVPADATFVICNYDRLIGGTVVCDGCAGKGSKPGIVPAVQCEACVGSGKTEDKSSNRRDVFDSLMARTWDLMASDEAHILKNTRTQRAQAVLGREEKRAANCKPAIASAPGLVDRCARRLILTGTPILNKPIEIQPLLAHLAPNEFGDFFRFAKRYADAQKKYVGNGRTVWDFNGASHLDELQHRLRAHVMVRRLKADVLKELPAKVRQIIVLPANGAAGVVAEEADAFDDFDGERREELEADVALAHASGDPESYRAAVAALGDFQTVAFREISRQRHKVALAKVPKAIEHLDGVLADGVEKIIVFGHHKDVIKKLATHFGDAAVTLSGETSMADRQAAVDRFQTDPTCKVFIGNILAAGVGITLTAASHVFFVELDWRPAYVQQAEDRAHRISQLNTVFVYHLVLERSLDLRMANMLIAKQAVADAALDVEHKIVVPVVPPPRHAPALQSVGASSASVAGASRDYSMPSMIDKDGAQVIYPVATQEQRGDSKVAMSIIAGFCDGARKLDGMGFNKVDARVGRALALTMTEYTDGQTYLAMKLARKYRKQLPASLIESLKIGPTKTGNDNV